MSLNKFWITGCLINLVACTGYQPPAPVYGPAPVYDPYQQSTQQPSGDTSQSAVTYPVPEFSQPEENTVPEASMAPAPNETSGRYSAKPMMPAAVALVSQSERYQQAGDLESAAVGLERALRISPRNPDITYKLAKVRLEQEKPVLAEDLAKKAALLARNNIALKRKCWLLISQARRAQHDLQGAKEAELKARQLR